ncbi:uncharacterized protein LOC116432589 isoform X1 [Nomia melanderi]|uniref:uncharacterized protein LOC116432589 isoform X1 n=1 Tax=Nomia melanderi TaxID=2448451 RepID=UPI0013041FC0|nr:uncharacterized protein LOC116432589 isoform X1 [Nomia melanderi]
MAGTGGWGEQTVQKRMQARITAGGSRDRVPAAGANSSRCVARKLLITDKGLTTERPKFQRGTPIKPRRSLQATSRDASKRRTPEAARGTQKTIKNRGRVRQSQLKSLAGKDMTN